MRFLNPLLNKKLLKWFSTIILIFIIIWLVFAIIPPKLAISNNPFIVNEGESPLIAAHRGGKNLNPENTFLAFDYSIENYDIDILELDLCMTKDNYLVSIHNLTINSSSDVEEVTGSNEDYFVKDHTLDELRNFNFGAKFKDKNGNYPYIDLVTKDQENRKDIIQNAKLNIVTINEIFLKYKFTDLKFIVEIKDDKDVGKKAADILNNLITENNLINRVVIGTFHDEVESHIKTNYSKLMRGGSVGEVTKFVLTQMFGVNIFDNSSFVCLQIPTDQNAFGIHFKLDKKTYINRAHRRNISVQYWTINDKETMRHLIKLGADVIMTDNPDLLYDVLKELGYR